MKKLLYILGLLLVGCNAENAWDCFQSTGDIVEENYTLEPFNQIIVWNRVQLILVEGDEQMVRIETGENLLNEIRVRVEDSILKVSDRNSCNHVRDYGVTKVYVTAPVDTLKVRNSSGMTVENIGEINNYRLVLTSVDPLQFDEFHIDGDFRLNNINVQQLRIDSNGLAKFYLSGSVYAATISLADGDTRVEAENLEIKNLGFFHRSTNKMIVNPTEVIRGRIVSIGDVISKSRPPIVEVEELFTGQLIFE